MYALSKTEVEYMGISKQRGEKFHTNLDKEFIFNILSWIIVPKNPPILILKIRNEKAT